MATVTSLGFSITSRYDGSGVRRARRDVNGLNGDLNRANRQLSISASSFNTLTAAATAFIPAISPIGTVAVGVLGGLSAALASAASAGGIWAAATAGAVKTTVDAGKKIKTANTALATQKATLDRLSPGTKAYATQLAKVRDAQAKVKDLMAGLSPVQQKFLDNQEKLTDAWGQFVAKTSSSTLGPINTIMAITVKHMGDLIPLVNDVGVLAQGVANKLKSWSDNGGLARFISILRTDGIKNLQTFLNIGQKLLTVLGIGFRAFLPLGMQIADALGRGANNLAKWAQGGGFTRFLSTVSQNGPAVKEFFVALGGALANLSRSMGQLGPISLGLTTNLLRIVAAMPPTMITALAAAFVAARVAVSAYNVAMGINLVLTTQVRGVTIGTRLAMLAFAAACRASAIATKIAAAAQWLWNAAMTASPVGLVIVGIAALVAAIIWIATKTTWFQTIWKVTWGFVKSYGIAVWNSLRSTGLAIWHGMQAAWSGFLSGMKTAWNASWGWIKSVGIAIWNAISRYFHGQWSAFRSSIVAFLNGVRSVWRTSWNAISSFTTGLWSKLKSTASGVWSFLKKGFSNTVSAIRTGWEKLRGILASPVRFAVNTVMGGLAKAWNGIVGKVGLGSLKLPVPHVNFADGGPVGKRRNMATGGKVNGPGGPRADKIPANLSAGEYVIPAHVVSKYGAGYFDNLIGRGGAMYKGVKGAFNGKNVVNAFDIPNPVKAIGKAASSVGSFVSNIGGKIKDWVLGLLERGVVEKLLLAPVKAMTGAIPGSGVVKGLMTNLLPKLAKGAVDLLMKKNDAAGFGGGKIPAGNHAAVIKAAMAMAHVPPPGTAAQWMSGLNTLITRESGWNAGAVNNWDVNAKNGNASRGLAQVIPTTFNAYAPAAARKLGIMNPVANVAAAIRYIVSRYGNITRVQQANASLPPKGYAMGGLAVNSFDRGGYLPQGLSLAYNGTGRPEPVGHDLKGGDGVHFHGCTFVGSSQAEWTDVFVKSYKDAKRKRRID